MLDQIPDLFIGIACFGVFLVLAVIGGALLQRASKSRNRRALTPLAEMLGGSVESDDHTAQLKGNYTGRPVAVRITPNKDTAKSSNYEIRVNAFEIWMDGVPGQGDWGIAYEGLLKKQWVVRAVEPDLQARLAAAGLVEQLKRIGKTPVLRFDAHRGQLYYYEDIRPKLVLPNDQCRIRLDLMVSAIGVNQRINLPDSKP